MNHLIKWLCGCLLMLMLTSMNSHAALISHTGYFSDYVDASTGQESGPKRTVLSDKSDIELLGFDSTLGTLTQVSFSYNFNARFWSELRVYDPSAGLFNEESVHGGGISAFQYRLFAKSDVPANFLNVRQGREYQLECDQDSVLIDNILNPKNGQCHDYSPSYSRNFARQIFNYTAQADLDYFLAGPLKISTSSVAGSVIEFCDDDEDWCRVSSGLSFFGGLQIDYEYEPFADSVPDPSTDVPEPTTIALLSMGLFGLLSRKNTLLRRNSTGQR